MVNKYIKKNSPSLVIWEMQIKAKIAIPLTMHPSEWLNRKRFTIKCWQGYRARTEMEH